VTISGVAKPELAMGKIILPSTTTAVAQEATNVAEETAVQTATPTVTEVATPAETVVETSVTETPAAETTQVVTETVAQPRAKGHASAVMTKAPAVDEIKEIEVNPAPFKAERYEGRSAGGQAATSSAHAAMSKPVMS
jgi:ribonuclease E